MFPLNQLSSQDSPFIRKVSYTCTKKYMILNHDSNVKVRLSVSLYHITNTEKKRELKS